MKHCGGCNSDKPLSAFSTNRAQRDGRCTQCKTCMAANSRRWVENNREQASRSRREYKLRMQFGVTQEWYESTFAAQGGVCAICGCGPDSDRHYRNRFLAVDHDHATGQVRGLLCHSCNKAIGQIGEDNLQRALDYVEAYHVRN